MVMVKSDEKSRLFRDRMEALKQFSSANGLPDTLTEAMREHIEIQFMREGANDEQVSSMRSLRQGRGGRWLVWKCKAGLQGLAPQPHPCHR